MPSQQENYSKLSPVLWAEDRAGLCVFVSVFWPFRKVGGGSDNSFFSAQHTVNLWRDHMVQNICWKNVWQRFGLWQTSSPWAKFYPPSPGSSESWLMSFIWVWVWRELLQLPLWLYLWDYCIWGGIKGVPCGLVTGWWWQPSGDKPPDVPQLWQMALNPWPLLGHNGAFPSFCFFLSSSFFFLLACGWGHGTPSINIHQRSGGLTFSFTVLYFCLPHITFLHFLYIFISPY